MDSTDVIIGLSFDDAKILQYFLAGILASNFEEMLACQGTDRWPMWHRNNLGWAIGRLRSQLISRGVYGADPDKK